MTAKLYRGFRCLATFADTFLVTADVVPFMNNCFPFEYIIKTAVSNGARPVTACQGFSDRDTVGCSAVADDDDDDGFDVCRARKSITGLRNHSTSWCCDSNRTVHGYYQNAGFLNGGRGAA
uniref:Uncharacterized protein n=1 Tax=Sipha flava TaxID=143950 RepID=A0A2S2QMD4_9HEMI